MALTELQVAVSFLPARERELGSFRFLCWLMANSAGTNMMFLLLVKLSRRFLPGCEFRSSQGPWNLAMVCLTLQALEYPDLRANLMGFIEMSQKWYPFAIGLMLSLLNGSVQWETFAAVIFASLWRKLGLERYLPSRSTAGKLEDQLHLPGLLSLLGGQWLPATRPQRPTRRSQERLAGADPDPGRGTCGDIDMWHGKGIIYRCSCTCQLRHRYLIPRRVSHILHVHQHRVLQKTCLKRNDKLCVLNGAELDFCDCVDNVFRSHDLVDDVPKQTCRVWKVGQTGTPSDFHLGGDFRLKMKETACHLGIPEWAGIGPPFHI